MCRIVCHINLDLDGSEVWPTELPSVPHVGDHIVSARKHGDFQLELAVVRITWQPSVPVSSYSSPVWAAHVELHMTDWQRHLPPKDDKGGVVSVGSIAAFYQWYAPLVGKSVGSFI